MVAENWLVTIDRRWAKGANGHYDHWLCQLNYQWHKKFIDSPEFNDYKEQVKYCWGVYQDGVKRGKIRTTFYWFNVRHKTTKLLTFNK